MKSLTAYLNFEGNAEEAMNFYKSAFGGEITNVMKYKDMPQSEKPPDEDKERIAHMALKKDKWILLCSDIPSSLEMRLGDNVSTISVPDLILDSIPAVNLSFLFIWGALLVGIVYVIYPLFFEPRKFHYAMGMLSLFILIRSSFIILTHLKSPIGMVSYSVPSYLGFLSYTNDLFFSGHAGLPFLGFLVFGSPKIRYFMLISSIILAITVLLMHVHYSIDVASAYFITYGIYVIGKPLFNNDEKSATRE